MKLFRIDERTGKKLSGMSALKRNVHRDPTTSAWLITEATRDRAPALSAPFKASPFSVDVDRADDVEQRFIKGYSELVHEPLPKLAADELRLFLYVNPELSVEYIGRGPNVREHALPSEQAAIFTLDIVGGQRNYHFRKVNTAPGALDERTVGLAKRAAQLRGWLLDPKARLVLSLGGGGFRMFAATSILRTLDRMLDDRKRIAEVWGTSGGAFLGYVYSSGFDPAVIDEFGYDLYHGRHPSINDGSTLGLARSGFNALIGKLRGRETPSDMSLWLNELDRKQPRAKRTHPDLPFYAIASNPSHTGVVALTDPRHIPDYCRDMLIACDPRHAVAASSAVPFLMRAQRQITGLDHDTWVDGSLADENPVSLPFIKWLRERERNPATTPKRLKILLVHLNFRSTEIALFKRLEAMPAIQRTGLLKMTAGLVDVLLESKSLSAIRLMTAIPDVEVLSLKLTMGALNFKDPRDIATSIQLGRKLSSWQVTTYRRGL